MKKETKKAAIKVMAKEPKEAPKGKKKLVIGGLIGIIIIGGLIASQFCCNESSRIKVPAFVETGTVVAKIGDKTVKLEELEQIKNSVPQLKDIAMEDVYEQLLEAYVNNKVILKAANAMNLASRPAVKKQLKDTEDQILVQTFLKEKMEALMTPERLQAIYQEEIKNFKPQEEIRARHILVTTEKEAKDLIIKLKAGAKFEELATKHSLDKNANGGDLGYFTKEMMIPDFANAAFEIKTGKVSTAPIKTPFGWHVVKVEDRRQAAPPAFEEVQEVIKQRFTEVMVPEIIKEERQKANVQFFDPLKIKEKKAAAATAAALAQVPAPIEEATSATEQPVPTEDKKADK